MNILASLVPGIRDVRAPLISGYLWLLFGWLVAYPAFDGSTGNAVEVAAARLGAEVSRPGLVVAASVAAYLVGSVSSQLALSLGDRWQGTDRGPSWLRVQTVTPSAGLGRVKAKAERALAAHWREVSEDFQYGKGRDIARRVRDRHATARAEVMEELRLPATILVGDNAALFAEVDRVRAEGEFRLSAALPLTALGFLLVFATPWWWLGLIAIVAAPELFRQGAQLVTSSRTLIANAYDQDVLKSSSVERYSRWVSDELPVLIARSKEVFDVDTQGEGRRSQAGRLAAEAADAVKLASQKPRFLPIDDVE